MARRRYSEEIKEIRYQDQAKWCRLPISFSKAKCTLDQYSSMDGGTLRFSNHYYQTPTWPIEEALDTIRHEYAHYIDHMVYGNLGHGSIWKKYCLIVGVLLIRCYNKKSTILSAKIGRRSKIGRTLQQLSHWHRHRSPPIRR